MNSDVMIIGGGVIGLTIARQLRKEGAGRVTIVERGKLGGEASFAAAGMLAPNAETDRLDDFFRLCTESNRLYDEFAAELLEETLVDIELDNSGTLYVALTETDSAELRTRVEWQKKAGLAVEQLSARETRALEPFLSTDIRESLYFPDDRQVENRKLLLALIEFAALNDINVIEQTEVTELSVENGQAVSVETTGGRIHADQFVIANGAWISLIKSQHVVMPRVAPIRGQMIAFRTAKRLFSKVVYSPRGYLVPRADGRLLAGATVEKAGFDKSVTDWGVEFLRDNALEIAPSLINLSIAEKWAGLRPFAPDGRPVIGPFEDAKNVFAATAHYRNGILLAPLTAKIIADKIVRDIDSAHLTSFKPQTFPADGLRSLNTTV